MLPGGNAPKPGGAFGGGGGGAGADGLDGSNGGGGGGPGGPDGLRCCGFIEELDGLGS